MTEVKEKLVTDKDELHAQIKDLKANMVQRHLYETKVLEIDLSIVAEMSAEKYNFEQQKETITQNELIVKKLELKK